MTEIERTIIEIKKEFFTYRNGMASQALKNSYPEGVLIYGLNLPQLKEIGSRYQQNYHLALNLWEDKKSRESRLLSLFLFPFDSISPELGLAMIKDVRSIEEAELLPFILLKNLPFSRDIIKTWGESSDLNDLSRYSLEMLKKNLSRLA